MAKKTDHLVFGAVWRWVGKTAGGTLDVMIVGPTISKKHPQDRVVIVLNTTMHSVAITYYPGMLREFAGFADPRWQHINV